jgi:hypothetical protein
MLWAEGMEDWLPAEAARPDIFSAVSHGSVSREHKDEVLPPQAVESPRSTKRRAVQRTAAAKKPARRGRRKFLWAAAAVMVGSAAISAFRKHPPGYENLRKVEEGLKGSTTGTGATPGEQNAAIVMAETAQALRDAGISKGSGKTGRGLAGLVRKAASAVDADAFTAVCTVQGDTAVFLLHVPDLRKFTDDAKQSMGHMAWFAARLGWTKLPEPRPARLCVGVKGIASYDRVLEGTASMPAMDADLSAEFLARDIGSTTTDEDDALKKLCSYFAGGPAK